MQKQRTGILSEYRRWQRENRIVSQWFGRHQASLMEKVKDLGVDRIELMGSRRWGLSYPESDIDAALVAVSDPGPIADAVAEFYGKRAERVKRLATKAGLHLVIVDPFLDSGLPRGRIKLEYTVQTPEQNRLIKMTGEEGAARMSPEERATYANSMRQCFLSGDEEGKSALKGWLKVLPEPRPQ